MADTSPAPRLVNATNFAVGAIAFTNGLQRERLSVVVKASYALAPGAPLVPRSAKEPLAAGDRYAGDPRVKAPAYESDFVPFKPRADLLCVGTAYPAGGRPATSSVVSFAVGSFQKNILVVGDRRWKLGIGRLNNTPTLPEAFTAVPLSFDRAYGGRDPADKTGLRAFQQNPIGRGFTTSSTVLEGLPLPNLEDPEHPIRSWKDQPAPMSFGPVGRTWQPRFKRVGTYDKRWLAPGAPPIPDDFDERYYNCAPDDQQLKGYLRGDERIRVIGMHPQHQDLTCQLPKLRVRCFAHRHGPQGRRLDEVPTNLDTLWVDMDTLALVLVWRGRFDLAGAKDTVVPHVLVVSEPLDAPPSPPETYRAHVDAFDAAEMESDATLDQAEAEAEASEPEPAGPE